MYAGFPLKKILKWLSLNPIPYLRANVFIFLAKFFLSSSCKNFSKDCTKLYTLNVFSPVSSTTLLKSINPFPP